MIYQCRNCGGALRFDVESATMVCDHCMSFFAPEEVNFQAEENTDMGQDATVSQEKSMGQSDLAQNAVVDVASNAGGMGAASVGESETASALAKEYDLPDDDDFMECNVYRCTACGGELITNELESSTFCAYCGQPTIVYDRVSKELKPKYIIPFAVTKQQAENVMRRKLNKGLFVPKEIKNFEVERLRGIYIPYWLCDMHYHDQQCWSGEVKSGKSTVKRYFYREAETIFEQMTLDASERLNDESSQRLEPFHMEGLKPFASSYMSGFYADRYDVSSTDIKRVAINRAKNLFDAEVEKSIKASSTKLISFGPTMDIRKLDYAMLPAWFLTFRYEGEPYTFLINGQTGKVVGGVPYSRPLMLPMLVVLSIVMSVIFAFLFSGVLSYSDFLDSESGLKLLITTLVLGGVAWGSAVRMYHKLNDSIERTKSKIMLHFVKDRTGGM